MPFDNPRTSNRYTAPLRDARHYIRYPSLWTKGKYIDGPRMCLVFAVRFASELYCYDDHRYLLRSLCKELPAPWRWMPMPARMKLILFNDYSNTTHSDIIGVVDRTIARECAKESCHV